MQLLVGLASTPDTLGNLARCRTGLAELGRSLGFDLLTGDRALSDRADAEAVSRQFAAQSVDLVLLLCNTFTPNGDVVLPFAALPARLGLWALPEPMREGPLPLSSLVALNLFASMLQHYGNGPQPRCKWFFGEVADPAFRRRLEVTIRALRAVKGLDGATIGYIGGHAPGFDNLAFDADALQRNLGVQVRELPLAAVIDEARACSEEEAVDRGAGIAAQASEVACSAGDLQATGRIALALQRVLERGRFAALAASCWPGFFQELGVFPCVAYGTLNAEGTIVACEGDVMSAVSLLALSLAGDARPTLMDMVSLLPDERAVCFWHCGLATWKLADSGGVRLITRPVPQADGSSADVGGFADVSFAPGAATVARIHRNGNELLVAGGEISGQLGPGYEGSSGWLTDLHMIHQRVTPTQFLDAVVRHGIEHHYAVLAQDVTDALVEFASWLGIQVIEPREPHDSV
jgi:L-fucose isomerase-like protein